MSKRRTTGRTARGDFFLILRRHVGHFDRPAAVGAHPRHRRFQGLVNPCRARAARLPAILRTSPSTGTPAASLRSVLGEGGGLSEPRPTRSGQLPPQVLDLPLLTLVLASQAVDLALLPVVLPLAPRQLFPEPLYLVAQPSYPFVAGIVAGQPVLVDHTRLMPYLSQKYNPKKMDLACPPAKQRPCVLWWRPVSYSERRIYQRRSHHEELAIP